MVSHLIENFRHYNSLFAPKHVFDIKQHGRASVLLAYLLGAKLPDQAMRSACQAQASRFSKEVFRSRLVQALDGSL